MSKTLKFSDSATPITNSKLLSIKNKISIFIISL